MQVAQVVTGLSLSDGGPSYSVPRLTKALREAGIGARIYADIGPGESNSEGSESVRTFHRQYASIPGLNKLHISRDLWLNLTRANVRFDLIHNHGLWRMANVYAGRAARRRNVPIIVSPRGMLSEAALQLSRRSKILFWLLSQKSALRGTACFHATSRAEYEDIRRFGIKEPVAIIPNGVDLPNADALARGSQTSRAHQEKILLFLGRIHPIKGVDTLVTAWSKVAGEFPDWRLRIVGPGEPAHVRQLADIVDRLGVPRVTIEGAVHEAEKWKAFAEADLFVQPSYSENFGLTVAESLACRRPVIITKGAPWQGVETHGCGWWIETGEPAMVAALRTGLGMPADALDAMGARGEQWVKHAFSWACIGEEMARVYRWLCADGSRPETVIID